MAHGATLDEGSCRIHQAKRALRTASSRRAHLLHTCHDAGECSPKWCLQPVFQAEEVDANAVSRHLVRTPRSHEGRRRRHERHYFGLRHERAPRRARVQRADRRHHGPVPVARG
eukprot:4990628-Pyramimonas_sp.AAC.1